MNVNIRKMNGPWDGGLSLDKHTLNSVYTGDNQYGHPTFDTTRSEIGESLYQLKYKDDYNQVTVILKTPEKMESLFKFKLFNKL